MDGSPRRRLEHSLENTSILPDRLTTVSKLRNKTTFTATEQDSDQKYEDCRIRRGALDRISLADCERIASTGLGSRLLSTSMMFPIDLESLVDQEENVLNEEEIQPLGLSLLQTIQKPYSGTSLLPRSISSNLGSLETKERGLDNVGGKRYTARSSYAIKYLNPKSEENQTEKELEVLDRLMKCQRPTQDSEGSISVGGCPFLQHIHYIFHSDEKIYVIHGHSERTLCDPYISSWFRLPKSFESSAIAPTTPDGIFNQRPERTQREVLESLRFLAAELTLGLFFLHGCGIVHQDIKPMNILVTSLGHVQISDFGAASLLPILLPGPDLSEMESPTQRLDHPQEFGSLVIRPDDVITFTPRYAAPELLRHNEDGLIIYDERVDWWSLGLTLNELAHGDINADLSNCPEAGIMRLDQFISQLLVVNPQDRLSGLFVREHEFFNFEPEVWEEIMDLRYPPCPPEDLESTTVHSDTRPGSMKFSLMIQPLASNEPQTDSSDALSTTEYNVLSKTDDQSSDTQPFPSTASLHEIYGDHHVGNTRSGAGSGSPFQVDIAQVQQSSSKSDSPTSPSRVTGTVSKRPRTIPCQSESMVALFEDGSDEDWENVTTDDMALYPSLKTPQTKSYTFRKSNSRQAKKLAKISKRTILVASRNIYATLRCTYN